MTTPNREQIYEKAIELWVQDQHRNGAPELGDKTPEYSELAESGYVASAQSFLMQSNPHCVVIEKKPKSEREIETSELQFDTEELLRSGAYTCGTSGSGKSDLAMYVADKLIEKGVIVYVIDASQDWIYRSNVPYVISVDNMVKIPIFNHSTIYDTSRLYVADQKQFIEGFCQCLYEYCVNQNPSDRKWRVVVFEESQLVYPNGSFRSDKKSASLQLVSVGRNFKIRFLAITPFSSNVDKYLVKTAKQRWFGWTCERNDLDYLKGFLGDRVEELERLKSGEFLYHFPQQNVLRKITIQPHERTGRLVEILRRNEETTHITEDQKNRILGSLMVLGAMAVVFVLLL